MEEKKAATQALIESIGKRKALADEAVEASRADEEAAAALQVSIGVLICSSYSTRPYPIVSCQARSMSMSLGCCPKQYWHN